MLKTHPQKVEIRIIDTDSPNFLVGDTLSLKKNKKNQGSKLLNSWQLKNFRPFKKQISQISRRRLPLPMNTQECPQST